MIWTGELVGGVYLVSDIEEFAQQDGRTGSVSNFKKAIGSKTYLEATIYCAGDGEWDGKCCCAHNVWMVVFFYLRGFSVSELARKGRCLVVGFDWTAQNNGMGFNEPLRITVR